MVVGPGTGLGKAYVVNGFSYPSEGGHTLIGVEDIHDYSLIGFFKKKFEGRVLLWRYPLRKGINRFIFPSDNWNIDETKLQGRGSNPDKPLWKSAEMITKYSSTDEVCDCNLKGIY